jgi:hypothetical protein
VLLPIKRNQDPRCHKEEKLATMQSVDGSFEGVYSTALALEILFNDQRSNLTYWLCGIIKQPLEVVGEQVSIE